MVTKSVTKMRNVGFDLTDFGSADKFKKVLKVNKLRASKPIKHRFTGGSYKTFVWKNKNVEMRTGNNPVTGQYNQPKMRAPEKGYASYIGIRGKPKNVSKLVSTIKKSTSNIKDYDPKRNPFIW